MTDAGRFTVEVKATARDYTELSAATFEPTTPYGLIFEHSLPLARSPSTACVDRLTVLAGSRTSRLTCQVSEGYRGSTRRRCARFCDVARWRRPKAFVIPGPGLSATRPADPARPTP